MCDLAVARGNPLSPNDATAILTISCRSSKAGFNVPCVQIRTIKSHLRDNRPTLGLLERAIAR